MSLVELTANASPHATANYKEQTLHNRKLQTTNRDRFTTAIASSHPEYLQMRVEHQNINENYTTQNSPFEIFSNIYIINKIQNFFILLLLYINKFCG